MANSGAVLAMCRSEGMGIAPWAAIGQGKTVSYNLRTHGRLFGYSGLFMSKAQIAAREKAGERLRSQRSETDIAISEALEKVADEIGDGATVTSVALAWLMAKTPYVFPIVGGRKIEYLLDNVKALSHRLTDEQVKQLGDVVPWSPGFPHTMGGRDGHSMATGCTANKFQLVPHDAPIKP